ncbi:hydroxycinnamoyltransferase [Ziziphus jujuba]|uniref:Hydroxycinnamoyltransferase n=1 Tax=Ziziphus jujuba TaxID=326968 RepID=A0A6P4ASS0_ZIZJJ|nr:hydroxycinnamoyltransferase [Ziziphus jujuba]
MVKSNVVPKLYIEGVQTIPPVKITEPRQVRRVLTADDDPIGLGLFGHCLHVVLYYNKAAKEDSGWFHAGWMKESLARILPDQPMIAGRLRRGDVDDDHQELEVVSNDGGVRFIEARVPVTLSEFLDSKSRQDAETELVFWKDIDEQNHQFCPLFYVQVTNFDCGGYSIGISCSILLADLLFKGNFLQKWAKMHNNMLYKNNVPEIPIFYLPNLKKDRRPVSSSLFSSNTRKNNGQTFIFDIDTKSIDSVNNTFSDKLALLCVEEAESKLGSKMASEFPLFLNEPSRKIIKVEKCSKHEDFNRKLSRGVSSEGWDCLGAGAVEFLGGNQPVHVSYWLGSISGGLVLAIPDSDPDHEAIYGGKIMVTIPKANQI